jgi:hypothetical protein
MTVADSLTEPTPMRNIYKSQMIDAKKKHKTIDVLKYLLLSMINQ